METKKLFIFLIISGLASVMGFAAYAMFGERLDGALPVTNTLSSEELAGVGYTSMTAADDSDIWEEDASPVWVRVTEVPDVTTTEAAISFPLDLNTASAEELMQIDGIGEVIAERIVDYAKQYGFNDVNDLLNVSGIGEKKLESIAPYVYVSTEEGFSESTVISSISE